LRPSIGWRVADGVLSLEFTGFCALWNRIEPRGFFWTRLDPICDTYRRRFDALKIIERIRSRVERGRLLAGDGLGAEA